MGNAILQFGVIWLAGWLLQLITTPDDSPARMEEIEDGITRAIDVFFSLAGITMAMRRLHDLGYSGWWLLPAVLLPLVVPKPAFFFVDDEVDQLQVLGDIFYRTTLLAVVVFFLFLLLKPGQSGVNEWGPNPKEQQEPA